MIFCNINELHQELIRRNLAPEWDARPTRVFRTWNDGRFLYTLTRNPDIPEDRDDPCHLDACHIRIPTASIHEDLRIFLHSSWPFTLFKHHPIHRYSFTYDDLGLVVTIRFEHTFELDPYLRKNTRLFERLGDQLILLPRLVARIVRVGLITGAILRNLSGDELRGSMAGDIERQLAGDGLDHFLRHAFKVANIGYGIAKAFTHDRCHVEGSPKTRETFRRILADFLISGVDSTNLRNLQASRIIKRCLDIQFTLLTRLSKTTYGTPENPETTCRTSTRIDHFYGDFFHESRGFFADKRGKCRCCDESRGRKQSQGKATPPEPMFETHGALEHSSWDDPYELPDLRADIPVPTWYRFPRLYEDPYTRDLPRFRIHERDEKPTTAEQYDPFEFPESWTEEGMYCNCESGLLADLYPIEGLRRWIDLSSATRSAHP